MKTLELKKIRKALEKELDPKRYEHTIGVEYTAAALAMRYDVSVRDAQIAGLLHDCAKGMSGEKMIALCEKHNIDVSEVERKNPALLHAKVGSFLAAQEYGVTDADVLHAIRNHTTGRPGMSTLEKIVFIADYIEPGRNKASDLDVVRGLAFTDLDAALLRILEDTLIYLKAAENMIDPMTQETYDYYKRNGRNGNGQ